MNIHIYDSPVGLYDVDYDLVTLVVTRLPLSRENGKLLTAGPRPSLTTTRP